MAYDGVQPASVTLFRKADTGWRSAAKGTNGFVSLGRGGAAVSLLLN